MNFQFRDYQRNTIESNRIHMFERGYKSPLNHLATGLGKTACAAGTIYELFSPEQHRTLFIVNRREIVRQTKTAFLKYYPDLAAHSWTKYGYPGVGIVMGQQHDDRQARIVIGTPQTLSGTDENNTDVNFERLDKVLEYGNFSLVVYDEAHYSVAKSYLLLHQHLLEANPNLKALGLTATPMRDDGLALGQMFDVINVSYDLRWGIKNGYLCPIQPPLLIETNMELPGEKGSVEERAKALDVKNWNEIMHKAYVEHGENRPGVWFMPSVEHSRQFARFMQQQGIPIAHIDGTMGIGPDGSEVSVNRREDILDWYNAWTPATGPRLLTNYEVLTTGWDAPHTAFIGWSRPTENPVILTQAIGRGTRLHPDKKDLRILDFALKGVEIVTVGTLFGHTWDEEKQKSEDDAELEVLAEGLDVRDMRKKDALVNGNGVIVRIGSLFGKNKNAWYSDPDNNVMSLACSETDILVIVRPNFTLAAKIRSGIALGEQALEQDPNNQSKQEFYNNLVQGYELFRNFTLWHVRAEVNDFGKKRWQIPETYVAADESIELLFDYAAPLQNELTDPKLSDKKRSWRRQPASDAQLKLLRNWGLESSDLPETKGDAAKLISHYTAVPKVMNTIYDIHAKCGRFGKIKTIELKAS